MAKQNNSLTELQALEGIYEHLSTIDNLSDEIGKISTRLSKIEQTHNTTLTTMTAFTESMTQSFEEMLKTKAAEIPAVLCKTETVQTVVREQFKETLKELNLKAEVSLERSLKMDEQIEKIKEIAKRSPLLSLHLNLTAKVFAIILALLLVLGAAGYIWFINTPMYLGDELYKSYARLNYPNPGAGYSTAYRLIEAGERKQLKDEIRRSKHRERSYIAYRDTLRQLLNDPSIFINRIQYENSERLIDYTDSTYIIKTAHFRKDGSIRITNDQRISTMADVRNTKGVKWKKIRQRPVRSDM